jgi:hypothetical protein
MREVGGMNKATLLATLLLVSGAFAYLVVDWTPPTGVTLNVGLLTLDTTYSMGCAGTFCQPYGQPNMDGSVRVNFSGVVEPYAAQIEVAGLSNCWITNCAKINPGNYENCETIPPNDPSFDQGGGNNVPWATITAGGNAYTTHLKYFLTMPSGVWAPSWPVANPSPNEGVRTIKAMCADFAGNLNATAIQDNIIGDFVDPTRTITYATQTTTQNSIILGTTESDQGVAPSGIVAAGSKVQVSSTAYSGGCGAPGAFADTTCVNNLGDCTYTFPTDCSCYKFRYAVKDAAGRPWNQPGGAFIDTDYDDPGNIVTVDKTGPNQVYITNFVEAAWQNTTATPAMTCADACMGCSAANADKKYKYYTQLGAPTCPTSSASYDLTESTKYPIGNHTWVCAAAKDNAGNWAYTTGTANTNGGPREFKIDMVVPSAPASLSETAVTNIGCPAFTWTQATDTGNPGGSDSGVKQYEITVARYVNFTVDYAGTDDDGFQTTTAAMSYTPATTHACSIGAKGGPTGLTTCLCQGKWVWRVRAQDNALNTGAYTTSTT